MCDVDWNLNVCDEFNILVGHRFLHISEVERGQKNGFEIRLFCLEYTVVHDTFYDKTSAQQHFMSANLTKLSTTKQSGTDWTTRHIEQNKIRTLELGDWKSDRYILSRNFIYNVTFDFQISISFCIYSAHDKFSSDVWISHVMCNVSCFRNFIIIVIGSTVDWLVDDCCIQTRQNSTPEGE